MAEIYFEDFIEKGVYRQRIKKETQKKMESNQKKVSTAVRMQWRLKD